MSRSARPDPSRHPMRKATLSAPAALAAIIALALAVAAAWTAGAATAAAPATLPPAPALDRAALAARVRAEMLHAWRGYERYAWGHDELRPVSRTTRDWYAEPLLMTPVDALDTLLLMGLDDEAAKARALIVERLGGGRAAAAGGAAAFDLDLPVKTFEITIRMLGGLLSSWQLTGDPRLLRLADDLGTRLLPAFASPTGMPYTFVNLRTGKTRGPRSNPAEIGTLLLEFGTLARATGKQVFYDKAKHAVVELYRRRSPLGLVGGESVGALNRYLADDAPTGLWYGQVDMLTGKRTATEFGALHAFLPAVLALGGDLGRARRLEASCFKMWNLHGIEPEVVDYRTMAVVEAGYPLRPEIVESAYYLRHYTRDPRYLEMGRTFLEGLLAHCRTEAGYTVLKNVVTKEKGDLMPR